MRLSEALGNLVEDVPADCGRGCGGEVDDLWKSL